MKRETGSLSRINMEKRKKTIDMLTRLYVHIIKLEREISSQEIGILYTLLIDLFKYLDVSWEVYVREIIESEYDYNNVIDYLNKNLIQMDKIRMVLSLVIMANTDNDFEISEITSILDICKKFNLNTDGFMNLVNYFEFKTKELVSIPYEQPFISVFHSIFSDYLIFGRDNDSDIRFRSSAISNFEMMLFSIDYYQFVATSMNANVMLNGVKLLPGRLYLLAKDSKAHIGDILFDRNILWKMYDAREQRDEIAFKKADYDFNVICQKSDYTFHINSGIVYLNGKTMQPNREYHVCYDDTLQIKGYSPFQLQDIIRERSRIGVDNIVPNELYINFEHDYYYISRTESSHSLAFIEVKDNHFYLYPPKRGWEIFLNEQKITEITPLHINIDTLTINKHHFRINTFYDLIEIPFQLDQLSVVDVKHYFPDGQLALDSISFDIKKGQLIGVMGQSGCGKSTLVKTISAEIIPTYGEVRMDGKNLYDNITYFTQHFGYVPQDDLLYPYLTVYENLFYRGRLRMPKISTAYLNLKINNILHQTNLQHRKNTRVGDFKKKFLSGGERKRLNIALELLFEPTIIICDEPTSGLSFSDTEQVIEILKNLSAQGKIVIITIHQPSVSIFQNFDRVLLMDMGGKQVYYGTPKDCFSYFDEEMSQITVNKTEIQLKKQNNATDYMYDIISYPEYNEKGELIYEQVNKLVVNKRQFNPEYWRDKYKRKMLYEIIHHDVKVKEKNEPQQRKLRREFDWKSLSVQFASFTIRNFKMKMRNRTNILITFLEAPLLALIIAFILRLAPEADHYSFYKNINMGIHIFVSIIVFVFLGLSNSIEEILDERKMALREKLMNLKMSYYLSSKIIALAVFSLIQILLYHIVTTLVLGSQGTDFLTLIYYFLAAVIGFSLGLLTSSFLKDNKAIINIMPLILIPQIIFGGAIIEYERMNRNLTMLRKSPIPEVVQFIPTRWLFEGLTTSYAKQNIYQRKLIKVEKKRLTLERMYKENEIDHSRYLESMDRLYRLKTQIAERWPEEKCSNSYLNFSVNLMDGRFFNTRKNVFLSSYKTVGLFVMRTWNFNALILVFYLMLFNLVTLLKLKFFFKE
jgi:ABC-type multidrug transport system ATPase subunit/ABC-type multidrug transport system permease subunit